jgi:APA family basic amino acid/polyamine antiporter
VPGLLKLLGVAFGIAVAIGNTIGSGILKAPGEIAALLPAPGLFIGVWIGGGLYAFCSALSIAELGTLVPRAGGQYVYARRALGDYAGFVVGLSDWLSTCGSTAASALVIGEYLALLVPALTGWSTRLAVLVTVFFALLQLKGVSLSGKVQEVTSLAKAVAFAALVAACFLAPAPGPAPAAAMPQTHSLAIAIILALQSVIFTFDGWTGVIYFSEEVKNPAREIPRSLILSVVFIAAIYLALNAALLHVASPAELAGATLAVGVAAGKVFGALGDPAIRWLTVLSMLAAINAFHLMASRILFGMARDGLFFKAGAAVNRGGTPSTALLVSTAAAVAFILSGTFEEVIAVLSFFFVANYAVSFTSLLVLRRREPWAERPFRVPLYPYLTIFTLLVSLAFLAGSIAGDPCNSLLALGALVASAPIFFLRKWVR